MGLKDTIKNFIAPEDGEIEMTKEEAETISVYEKPKNSSLGNIAANTNIALFEPRNFEEAEEIAYHIKSGKACCINLHRMPIEYRQRVLDFLSGVVCGVEGSIKKLGNDVILCSPRNLKVSGDINCTNKEEEDY